MSETSSFSIITETAFFLLYKTVQKQYVKEVYKRCISASRLVMQFQDNRSVIDPKFLTEPHLFHAIDKIEESNWDHAGMYIICMKNLFMFT